VRCRAGDSHVENPGEGPSTTAQALTAIDIVEQVPIRFVDVEIGFHSTALVCIGVFSVGLGGV